MRTNLLIVPLRWMRRGGSLERPARSGFRAFCWTGRRAARAVEVIQRGTRLRCFAGWVPNILHLYLAQQRVRAVKFVAR